MTAKVRFRGWSPGLKKVALTKLIREEAGLPLDEAHVIVNRLLAGETIDIPASSERDANLFALKAQKLGAEDVTLVAEVSAPN